MRRRGRARVSGKRKYKTKLLADLVKPGLNPPPELCQVLVRGVLELLAAPPHVLALGVDVILENLNVRAHVGLEQSVRAERVSEVVLGRGPIIPHLLRLDGGVAAPVHGASVGDPTLLANQRERERDREREGDREKKRERERQAIAPDSFGKAPMITRNKTCYIDICILSLYIYIHIYIYIYIFIYTYTYKCTCTYTYTYTYLYTYNAISYIYIYII